MLSLFCTDDCSLRYTTFTSDQMGCNKKSVDPSVFILKMGI
ncbi:hypothetical protein P689_11915 [Candidatus Riesia pediculischaeffi PTSU]|uniref:Uncharacterized protein n=1 Tax=Candidatus Riesia pediculischaeffi PTSU TaxID=1401651 RepID=A0A0C1V6H3_9ENTR|nr:hypothetical protein P689_11915 [Candidatus Riesia pediculischaeffi PTSU]